MPGSGLLRVTVGRQEIVEGSVTRHEVAGHSSSDCFSSIRGHQPFSEARGHFTHFPQSREVRNKGIA